MLLVSPVQFRQQVTHQVPTEIMRHAPDDVDTEWLKALVALGGRNRAFTFLKPDISREAGTIVHKKYYFILRFLQTIFKSHLARNSRHNVDVIHAFV